MKEKAVINNPINVHGKSRRLTSVQSTQENSLKEGAANSNMATAWPSETIQGDIQWSSFDPSTLNAYRYEYRLNTPAAFNNPYNQIALSRSSIGRMSPTMAVRKDERRQSKDQLVARIRKHFKCMGIVENDVVVEFLYKVRYQDKHFRMRFAPQQSR